MCVRVCVDLPDREVMSAAFLRFQEEVKRIYAVDHNKPPFGTGSWAKARVEGLIRKPRRKRMKQTSQMRSMVLEYVHLQNWVIDGVNVCKCWDE